MLFVLVTDVLSAMFNHALEPKILVSMLLGPFKSRCNLHYADDLMVLTTEDLEDLRIVKLILYLFEGMSGLHTNFSKTYLYLVGTGDLPEVEAAATLSCATGLLPVTYLGLPISSRRSSKQDWEGIIAKVRQRLSSWKIRHLSIGGRLTLVNSMLSALPTYLMPIFILTYWVIKAIDRIRRDFF